MYTVEFALLESLPPPRKFKAYTQKRCNFVDLYQGVLALSACFAAPALAETKGVPRTLGPVTMQVVPFQSTERAGTIHIYNDDRLLFRTLGNGTAERFEISVGRDGFLWTGVTYVGRKVEWPEWRPPAAMRLRDPSLPSFVPSGPYNPLGARALYLYASNADTLYRIHGTNSAETVGGYETSGCFRLTNSDVINLFKQVPTGTKVIVQKTMVAGS